MIRLGVDTFSPVKTEIDKGIDGPNAADVAKYTNITPVMQVSEIVS